MHTRNHVGQPFGAHRWARFSRPGALGLASILLIVGCDQEATAPPHPGPVSPQVVSARKPIERFHGRFSGSAPSEICGIPVELDFVAMNNYFLHEDGSVSLTTSGSTTITNPANGNSVVISFAGHRPSAAPILDAETGILTFVSTFKGLSQKLQTANGPVLVRDAGIITIVEKFHYDTGTFLSSEIIVNKGPHPESESDFTLFCEVVLSELT
ncbi:MAG TPA: hypothetical protein VJ650_09910 [Gemmatimonadaceae bacterium]|nr:hypothetical protein [Gemmatimonadaceae bacterium]